MTDPLPVIRTELDALTLCDDPDPSAWKPWQETQAVAGQWFLWRDGVSPDLHADQVDPDDQGFIALKYGCGLDYYPECQPLRVDGQ